MGAGAEIDILENSLRKKGELLDILLRDRTMSLATHSRRNIIWATDSYEKFGKQFVPKKQMRADLVTGKYGKLIQPRASKPKDEQQKRTKDKAEVFTPLHIVDQMNKQIDWAGKNYPATEETWQNYVRERRLEITCGEAPFIASRYDPTKRGQLIKLENRVGFLDRKLSVVSEYCKTPDEWLHWAREAYKASYGYEWQGDNLLIARENLLYTLIDYYKAAFKRAPSPETQLEFAEIISWNIWQMDGIKGVVPMSCKETVQASDEVPKNQITMPGILGKPQKIKVECEGCRTGDTQKHTGVYTKIMDWQIGKRVRFVDVEDKVARR